MLPVSILLFPEIIMDTNINHFHVYCMAMKDVTFYASKYMLYHVMLCYVILCNVMSCHVMVCLFSLFVCLFDCFFLSVLCVSFYSYIIMAIAIHFYLKLISITKQPLHNISYLFYHRDLLFYYITFSYQDIQSQRYSTKYIFTVGTN